MLGTGFIPSGNMTCHVEEFKVRTKNCREKIIPFWLVVKSHRRHLSRAMQISAPYRLVSFQQLLYWCILIRAVSANCGLGSSLLRGSPVIVQQKRGLKTLRTLDDIIKIIIIIIIIN